MFANKMGLLVCCEVGWRHNRWCHVVMNFNDVIIIGGQYLIELNSGKGNGICQWILLMHFDDSFVTFFLHHVTILQVMWLKITSNDRVSFVFLSFPLSVLRLFGCLKLVLRNFDNKTGVEESTSLVWVWYRSGPV